MKNFPPYPFFESLMPHPNPENQLPIYSGGESFFTIEWSLDKFASTTWEVGTEASSCSAIIGKMIEVLFESRKEEWMFTDVLLSYRPEGNKLTAKVGMRRKSVHEELQKKDT